MNEGAYDDPYAAGTISTRAADPVRFEVAAGTIDDPYRTVRVQAKKPPGMSGKRVWDLAPRWIGREGRD